MLKLRYGNYCNSSYSFDIIYILLDYKLDEQERKTQTKILLFSTGKFYD